MLSSHATNILAYGVLGLTALLPLAMITIAWKRTGYTLAQYLLFQYNRSMTQFVWNLRIRGRIDLPPGQGAILVCNHRAGVDPAYIVPATRRMTYWMVAREYVEFPLLAWFFRTMEVIPVNRGGVDTKSTKTAIRRAAEGGIVGMFIEGRINQTENLLLPGRPGAAMVALKAKVPVIPCYIHGAPYAGTYYSSLFMRAQVRVKIGQPIDLTAYFDRDSDKEVLEQLTLRFLREIAALAGYKDYPVEMGGRVWKTQPAEV